MPWPIRMVPAPGDLPENTPWAELRVGDMWLAPYLLEGGVERVGIFYPAQNYFAQNAGRPPLVVRLPGPCDFSVDGPVWSGGRRIEPGWRVEGDAPGITVQPSVNIGGCYHGWIQGGVITDDCEGRVYDAQGRLVRAGQ